MKKTLTSAFLLTTLFGVNLNINLPNDVTYNPISNQQANLQIKTPNKEIRKTPLPMKSYDKVIGPNIKLASSNIDIDHLKTMCSYYTDLNKRNAFDDGYKYGKNYLEFYIGNKLLNLKYYLDILFPIKKLYIKGILRPPLISIKENNTMTFDNGNSYSQNNVRYSVIQKAKFSKTPETWEDFLLIYPVDTYKKYPFQKNITMNFNLELTNKEDCNKDIKKYSKIEFIKGFNKAAKEVEFDFETRLDGLDRYITSLFNYYNLYLRGVVTPPIIGDFTTPIEVKPNKDLVINEKVFTIIKPAHFNTDTFKYKTIIIPNESVYIK